VTPENIHRHLPHMPENQVIGVHSQVIGEHIDFRPLLVMAYMVNLVTYHHLVTLASELVNNLARNLKLVTETVRMQHFQVWQLTHVMV